MDADTRDRAKRRAAAQAMTVAVRPPLPEASDGITKDLVSIGNGIGARRLIVQVGDDDGYEECLATHWGVPSDPD